MAFDDSRQAIDKQIERYHELREMDEWLAREHVNTRTELTNVLVSLQARCQAEPEWKDYVTKGLHGKA
ncbi:hypothetical protein SEA_DARDANUS_61 [Gordonia phage Dardanus]|uniref:Uncharacterized protein n=1 Tax=Gordonia phage Dardanus TaxID=2588489 RepID=A0A514CX62_9CAUD|nr:hypothetical protein KDJ58_gp61 [Gordonia phage Dardanus]QDH85098.1 hypothetical protein SEA_DARDANUS_61 [Gordonia phage Dardanus]